MKELYEKDTKFRAEGEQTPARRRELCGPIIKAIDTWPGEQKCLPKSPMRKALHYMNDNWDGPTAFLDDPEPPLDNNPAE